MLIYNLINIHNLKCMLLMLLLIDLNLLCLNHLTLSPSDEIGT